MLCGDAEAARVLFRVHHEILRCPGCELVYARFEGGAQFGEEYPEAYYHGLVYANYVADRPAIRRNAARALTEFESLTRGRRLLDVGCATGFFLEAARERGWNVRGLEVSKYASEYARSELGLPVDTASIQAPPAGLPRFDVITLWDIIEHLNRPDQALGHIHSLLDEGGLLAISTGDHGSLLRRVTGARWRLFSDPTHRYFFDERTLRRLLVQGGYRVLSVKRKGKWVGLSMALQQSPLPLGRSLQRWLGRRGWHPAFFVNLWDVMTVLATRSDSPALAGQGRVA